MSAPVVIPSNPSATGTSPRCLTTARSKSLLSSSSSSTTKPIINKSSSSLIANRFRPPRKPEIQVNKEELKKKLSPLQYKVTQEKFTERPFSGEYIRLNTKGIYCCVVCDEELFSSDTKYDSGCGWPAFFNAIDTNKLILQADLSHVGGNLLLLALNQDLARIEVICAKCGAHLGHVFDDGPKPTGKRYCVNSASLKFKQENGEICDVTFDDQCCLLRPASLVETRLSNTNVKNSAKQQQPESKELLEKKNVMTKPVLSSPAFKSSKFSKDTLEIQKVEIEIPITIKVQKSSDPREIIPSKKIQSMKERFLKSMTIDANDDVSLDTEIPPSGRAITTTIVNISASGSNENSSKLQISNRIKKIQNSLIAEKTIDDNEDGVGKNDLNNNRITLPVTNKYGDVKSRYLDHLNSLSKQSVIKHTSLHSRRSLPVSRNLLETDL